MEFKIVPHHPQSRRSLLQRDAVCDKRSEIDSSVRHGGQGGVPIVAVPRDAVFGIPNARQSYLASQQLRPECRWKMQIARGIAQQNDAPVAPDRRHRL